MKDTRSAYVESDTVYRLESNVDDCTGEALGYVMELLMKAGAKDVSYTPVFMKKNRPAYQINVICAPEDVERMEDILFEETTTIGIRRMQMERSVLRRREITVETAFGPARVKECVLPDGRRRRYPEYESAAAMAGEQGISLQEALTVIRRACGDDTVK